MRNEAVTNLIFYSCILSLIFAGCITSLAWSIYLENNLEYTQKTMTCPDGTLIDVVVAFKPHEK